MFSICAPEGTTWELVCRHDWGYAADVGSPEAILASMEIIFRDWQSGILARRSPSAALINRFSAARQVKDLMELCDQVRSAVRNGCRPPPAIPDVQDWP